MHQVSLPASDQTGMRVLVELPIVRQHAADEVVDALRLDDRQQRMLGAEGVPQRERAVVLEAFGRVDLVIEAAVAAVGVVEQRRAPCRSDRAPCRKSRERPGSLVWISILPSTSLQLFRRGGDRAVEIHARESRRPDSSGRLPRSTAEMPIFTRTGSPASLKSKCADEPLRLWLLSRRRRAACRSPRKP